MLQFYSFYKIFFIMSFIIFIVIRDYKTVDFYDFSLSKSDKKNCFQPTKKLMEKSRKWKLGIRNASSWASCWFFMKIVTEICLNCFIYLISFLYIYKCEGRCQKRTPFTNPHFQKQYFFSWKYKRERNNTGYFSDIYHLYTHLIHNLW